MDVASVADTGTDGVGRMYSAWRRVANREGGEHPRGGMNRAVYKLRQGAGTLFGRLVAVAIVCAAFAAGGVAASGAASPAQGPPVTHGPGGDSSPDKHHDKSP